MWLSHIIQVNKSLHTCEWVTSHMWMRHVPHMNVSCPTYEWVTSRRHTCEGVMSHKSMNHVKHLNETHHTPEWVRSHTWVSHVTHMNESCHTCERVNRALFGRWQIPRLRELQNCSFTHPSTNFITPQHTLHHTLFHIDLKRSFWPFYFRPKSLKSQQKSPISWQKSPISL